VGHHAPAARQALEASGRKRLPDVEQPEQQESHDDPRPPGRRQVHRDQVADDLVVDDGSGIVTGAEPAFRQTAQPAADGEQHEHDRAVGHRPQFPQQQIYWYAGERPGGARHHRRVPETETGGEPQGRAMSPMYSLLCHSPPSVGRRAPFRYYAPYVFPGQRNSRWRMHAIPAVLRAALLSLLLAPLCAMAAPLEVEVNGVTGELRDN